MVDELLRLRLGERAAREVALDVDIKEGRDAPDAHRCAVLRLDRCEVGEVEPLHRLACILRGLRDVKAVECRHLLHALQRTDLLRDLLTQLDDVVRHDSVAVVEEIALLERDEMIDAIERDTAVVAHDSPASVGVGQPRNDVAAACRADFLRVGVKDRRIVRLVIFRKDLVELRADLVAVVLECLLCHADAAVGHERLLERLVRLQSDDFFEVFQRGVDIAGAVCRQARDDLRLHVEDAALRALLLLQFLHARPQAVRRVCRRREKALVAIVRRVVALDEVTNIDLLLPDAPFKAVPALALQHILPPILQVKIDSHMMLS